MARPATVTGPEAIAKAEMIARLMQARLRGTPFRAIAALEGLSTATAHRLYWRTLDANPPNRRRQLAALERAMLPSDGA
jgi:hypothetical protein